MSSFIYEGEPIVLFFISDIVKIQEEISDNEIFETFIVLGCMHELDHLALDLIPKGSGDHSEVIDIETKTWNETCLHTISKMVRIGKQLPRSEKLLYDVWTQAWITGKPNIFESYIENLYR